MNFTELDLKKEYRTSIDSMSKDFYAPILKRAVKYDRAVGFFSSSSLANIATGLLPFVKKGGYIRLVASPVLTDEDVNAIKAGYKKREEIINEALKRELLDETDFVKSKKLDLLANMIADGYLDIRIAITELNKNYGIYHEKMGIFTDEDENRIAFSGSMNETFTAMEINYESIDVYCSWLGDEPLSRIETKEKVFENIWNGEEPTVFTLEIDEVKESILKKYKREKVDYSQLDDNEFEDESVVDIPIGKIQIERNLPHLIDGMPLFDYQNDAIDEWEKNQYRGIFDMATGTGKTHTGLGALVRLSEHLNGKLGVVIACPYQHLVEQWVEDIVLYGINPIVGYGSSREKNWKKHLENAVRDQKLKVKNREFFCFVTTNATFSSDFVQSQLLKVKSNLLLIVDEAHNFGATNLRKLLSPIFSYRLALSATLNRHGDPEGTQALRDYFGKTCIEYDLERAINEDKLTEYKYYPIIVSLSDTERNAYDELTRKIGKCVIQSKSGKMKLSEKGKKLALKRSRLVAGAITKISKLEELIGAYVEDKHILVYCGATRLLEDDEEETSVEAEDLRQIDVVTDLLGNELHMKVSQFTSKEDIEERNILKKEFSDGDNLQALIAIKCLDEGVNIPKIKVAFILASTNNPKEYIQRRGRVLRKAKGKEFAEIYDFITLPRPLDEVPSLTEDQMQRELTLVKNELCRALEFARLAKNRVSAMSILDEIAMAYNIDVIALEFKEDFSYEE